MSCDCTCDLLFSTPLSYIDTQHAMQQVLRGLEGICLVYIDDLIIVAITTAEMLERIDRVFARLAHFGFRIKESKCQFGKTSVTYLGHVVDGTGVRISPTRLEAIATIAQPANIRQLRSFVGMASYVRAFIKDFAIRIRPLSTSMCKTKLEWTEEMTRSFNDIKAAILEAPLLRFLDYASQIIVQTDASVDGVGAMLFQEDLDGNPQPVAYASKAFNATQSNWSTVEQEMFAVVFAVSKFEHHLRGHPFILKTDSRNLVHMKNSKVPKIIRWSLFLQEFEMTPVHIPGKSNVVCDALSRLPRMDATLNSVDVVEVDDDIDMSIFHGDEVGHFGITKTVESLRVHGYDYSGMIRE